MTLQAKLISLILLIMLPVIGLVGLFFFQVLMAYQEQSIALKMVASELDDLIDTIQNKMRSISLENVPGV